MTEENYHNKDDINNDNTKDSKEDKEIIISKSGDKEKGNNNQDEGNKYHAEILNLENGFSEFDLNFKIIIIGNSGVGKTCITNMATKNIFSNKYQATIGMEIFSLYVKLKDINKLINLQIWDTCGQEMYRSLISNFYRRTSLAILVYSIDKRESFKDIDLWLKELKTNNSPDTKIMLVGNKLDLEKNREVPYEEAKKCSEDFNFCEFFETSAKTGENVKKMFIKAATILYDEAIKFNDNMTDATYSTFRPTLGNLRNSKGKKHKKKKWC